MSNSRKLRLLEGLGYCGALMIGVGGLIDVAALKYFNVLGLVFAIVAIVRLMVMLIAQSEVGRLYETGQDFDIEDEQLLRRT